MTNNTPEVIDALFDLDLLDQSIEKCKAYAEKESTDVLTVVAYRQAYKNAVDILSEIDKFLGIDESIVASTESLSIFDAEDIRASCESLLKAVGDRISKMIDFLLQFIEKQMAVYKNKTVTLTGKVKTIRGFDVSRIPDKPSEETIESLKNINSLLSLKTNDKLDTKALSVVESWFDYANFFINNNELSKASKKLLVTLSKNLSSLDDTEDGNFEAINSSIEAFDIFLRGVVKQYRLKEIDVKDNEVKGYKCNNDIPGDSAITLLIPDIDNVKFSANDNRALSTIKSARFIKAVNPTGTIGDLSNANKEIIKINKKAISAGEDLIKVAKDNAKLYIEIKNLLYKHSKDIKKYRNQSAVKTFRTLLLVVSKSTSITNSCFSGFNLETAKIINNYVLLIKKLQE